MTKIYFFEEKLMHVRDKEKTSYKNSLPYTLNQGFWRKSLSFRYLNARSC